MMSIISLVALNDEHNGSYSSAARSWIPNPNITVVLRDESGIARANHMSTPRIIAGWASALVNPDSRYYHDSFLLTSFG